MVTIHKMNENEIGNRGSKSNVYSFVKEQRIDGSYLNDQLLDYMIFKLRCILMRLERVYQNKIPAKLSINLSSLVNNSFQK